jgi:hypothetical protein
VFAFKVDGEEDLWIRSAELANMENIIECLIAEVDPRPVRFPCVPLGVVDLSMRDLVDAVYGHPFQDAPYDILGGRHCQVCSAAFFLSLRMAFQDSLVSHPRLQSWCRVLLQDKLPNVWRQLYESGRQLLLHQTFSDIGYTPTVGEPTEGNK